MAMEARWVDAIFDKLMLVYGQRFSQQYGQLGVPNVKADWAHELDGINGESVNHALKNLPADFPPNVLQFKALCQQERPPMRVLIAHERAERMSAKVRQKLGEVVQRMREQPSDPLDGARSLRAKEKNGILLTRAQKEFWRQALAREIREERSDESA